ncbi:AraC family transcriptional regulator [Variovorax sp. H27-G14]|uniref:helix-turn-helix domain-containing protein n=1 Tax=Variovorax sp. H27-G14 TaxID=3111914 RepID=UPI0038FC25F7
MPPLRMSTSTLQRRLASENTSFRAIRDGLRREIAIARLNSTRIPLAVLASELGFSDSAAVHRAFKTWTGVSRGSLRRPTRTPGSTAP